MDWAFDITMKSREALEKFLEKYSMAELNKVPNGFNNNIIWNVAHTIVTQQVLVYRLSEVPTIVADDVIETYRKGTRPTRDVSQTEVDMIKGLLYSTIHKTQEDYDNGIFKNYNEYTVTTQNTLTNVEEAIEFNNFHEGLHLGYILALKNTL